MRAYDLILPNDHTRPSAEVAQAVFDGLTLAGATDLTVAVTINPDGYTTRRSVLIKGDVPVPVPVPDVVAEVLDLPHRPPVATWEDPGVRLVPYAHQGTVDAEVAA